MDNTTKLVVIVTLYVILNNVFATTDPCDSPRGFPDLQKRSSKYIRQANETPITDRYIDAGWYGNQYVKMSTAYSGYNTCGTLIQMYLEDNTTITNISTSMKVCIAMSEALSCVASININAKYCDKLKFTIYELKRSITSPAAYCVDINIPPVPNYVTEVSVSIPNLGLGFNLKWRFICEFELSPDPTYWYTVRWYTDGQLLHTFPPLQSSNVKTESTLHEDNLQNPKTLGFKIRCSYSVSFEQDSNLSPAVSSNDKFIGIEILTPELYLTNTQSAEIQLRATAPIGCWLAGCNLHLNVHNSQADTQTDPGVDPCTPSTEFQNCGIEISGENWNQIVTLTVRAKHPHQYGHKVAVNIIHLQTIELFLDHRIWGNYSIGDVTVHVTMDTSIIQGKICSAVSDPHMTTFEKKPYEQHIGGRFTFYENIAWKQEVQIQTTGCWGGIPRCVCGVAVRAGSEVLVISRCETGYLRVGFSQCDDSKIKFIDVKKTGSSYKIRLPAGTEVNINQYSGFLNVYVHPATADISQTNGLCGRVGDVRFFGRDDIEYQHFHRGNFDGGMPGFSNSWGMTAGVIDLFSENINNLTPMGPGIFYCKCTAVANGKPVEQFTCDNNATLCPLDQIENFKPVRECKINIVKKRSAGNHLKIPTSLHGNKYHHVIHKRNTVSWKNGWTEETAKSFCESFLSNSSTVQICSKIPAVDITSPLANCILDVQLSGGIDYAPVAVDTIRTNCIHEVEKDTTLQESSLGNISIFEELKAGSCPADCLANGICNSGVCRCNEGFGGSDCSVLTSNAPVLEHLDNGGFCDVATRPCPDITVFGGDFIDTAFCKITLKHLSVTGDVEIKTTTTTKAANVESLGELACTLPSRRQSRSVSVPVDEFIQIYEVSVSNDDNTYSNTSTVVIYNSKCQTCSSNNTVECVYTGDYCISGGECYRNGESHLIQPCYSCSVIGEIRSWVLSSSDPVCSTTSTTTYTISTSMSDSGSTTDDSSTETDETNIDISHGSEKDDIEFPTWIIGAVAGAIILLASTVAVLYFLSHQDNNDGVSRSGHCSPDPKPVIISPAPTTSIYDHLSPDPKRISISPAPSTDHLSTDPKRIIISPAPTT